MSISKQDIKAKIQAIKVRNNQRLLRRESYPAAVKAFGVALKAVRGCDANADQIDSLLKSYDEIMKTGQFSHNEAIDACVWLWSDGLYTENAAINAAIDKALK